jgi:hypothetical protein
MSCFCFCFLVWQSRFGKLGLLLSSLWFRKSRSLGCFCARNKFINFFFWLELHLRQQILELCKIEEINPHRLGQLWQWCEFYLWWAQCQIVIERSWMWVKEVHPLLAIPINFFNRLPSQLITTYEIVLPTHTSMWLSHACHGQMHKEIIKTIFFQHGCSMVLMFFLYLSTLYG